MSIQQINSLRQIALRNEDQDALASLDYLYDAEMARIENLLNKAAS
ncbi:hypothetical protein ACIBH1_05330 [Nonomuraea sp. NPDC050663]